MPKLIDMTGWKMWEHGVPESRLEVIKRYELNDTENKPQWLCRCTCGNTIIVTGKRLKNGNTKSCGCLQPEKARQNGEKCKKDLTGQRFGLLTVLERMERKSGNNAIWRCQCDCGNIVEVINGNLGRTTHSCGCLKKSVGEMQIEQILIDNNYNYLFDKPYFKDLILPSGGIGRYDFIILNQNNNPYWLIEFDGEQHYKKTEWFNSLSLEQRQENDNIKNLYAKNHNLPLVRIPYYMKNKVTKDILFGEEYLVRI